MQEWMASKKKHRPSKAVRVARGASVVDKKGVPWLAILSVVGIVASPVPWADTTS